MTWVRIDDNAPHHPKLRKAGPEAAWLWVAGLAHCNRFATDGRVDALDLDVLYPFADWNADKLRRLATRLVDVGLWLTVEGGYVIHDYAEFQGEALRSARDERRKWETERKAKQRANARAARGESVDKQAPPGSLSHRDRGGTEGGTSPGTAVGHVAGTGVGPTREASPDTLVSQPPDPTRPDPSETTHTPAREAPRPVDALVTAGGIVEPDIESARLLNDAMCSAGITCALAASWGADLATPQGRKVCWPWMRSPDSAITATFLRSCDLTRGEEVYVRLRDGFAAWRLWHGKRAKASARPATSRQIAAQREAPVNAPPPRPIVPNAAAVELARVTRERLAEHARTAKETP